MITYVKLKTHIGDRYQRKNDVGQKWFVAEAKVPPIVKQMFEDTQAPEVQFDDKPDKPRCIFCEAPGIYGRYFLGETLDLCNDHYYSKTLGAIAAQYKLIQEKRQRDGILTPKSKAGKQKKQSQLR